jgi:hypothetical protein
VTADGPKKGKEPDIPILIFKNLKEITVYQPNLSRVEMEDFKGLELVLLLGAIVIRDVYFGQLKEAFHVTEPVPINGNVVGHAALTRPASRPQVTIPAQETRPSPMDARSKWELEAEASQLRKQQEAEARERRRREQEQERMTHKLLKDEEKAARLKQAEIDKETERLKKLYGDQTQTYQGGQSLSPAPPLPSRPPPQKPPRRPPAYSAATSPQHQFAPSNWQFSTGGSQPPYGTATGGLYLPQPNPQLNSQKSSFFGLRRGVDEHSGGGNGKLHRKRSSIF